MSSSVRSALVQSFVDLAAANSWDYPIIAENHPQEPNHSGIWFGLTYIPDIPDVATLGDGGEDEVRGIFQIDIFTPINTGEKEPQDLIDVMRSYFTAGRRFSYNQQEVVITQCGRTDGFISNNYFRIPLSVIWYSRLIRTINT